MSYETDLRILGGLPVTIGYTVQPAEPDVGISDAYVDDWYIVAVNNRPYKGEWLYNRIGAKKGERDRILEALNEDAGERAYDD